MVAFGSFWSTMQSKCDLLPNTIAFAFGPGCVMSHSWLPAADCTVHRLTGYLGKRIPKQWAAHSNDTCDDTMMCDATCVHHARLSWKMGLCKSSSYQTLITGILVSAQSPVPRAKCLSYLLHEVVCERQRHAQSDGFVVGVHKLDCPGFLIHLNLAGPQQSLSQLPAC